MLAPLVMWAGLCAVKSTEVKPPVLLYRLHLRRSRDLLLQPLRGRQVTYFRTYGNLGDRLINAGARRLLAGIAYSEYDIRDAKYLRGDIAIVGGGGGWCTPWHSMPALLKPIERRFESVLVWPSSFDLREQQVAKWLETTKATVPQKGQDLLHKEIQKLIDQIGNLNLAADDSIAS